MGRLSKSALLEASDLEEREVELPKLGGSVKVRGLGAAYSLDAQSEATELKQVGNDQFVNVNRAKMEILQALHGLVDPKLDNYAEAERFARQCGPSFAAVIEVIDELSNVDKEAIAETTARFPSGGESTNGTDVGPKPGPGDDRSDVHLRAGGDAGQDRQGALHG